MQFLLTSFRFWRIDVAHRVVHKFAGAASVGLLADPSASQHSPI
jgi:hypothetical protein